MGVFGKLAFWKKKDEFADLGKDLGFDKDFGQGDEGMNPDLGLGIETTKPEKYPSFQQPSQSGFQQQNFQQPTPSFNQGLQQYPQYSQPYSSAQDQNYVTAKNLEVISSKLDALRASLDSINQRLANIEAIARGEQDDKRRRYY